MQKIVLELQQQKQYNYQRTYKVSPSVLRWSVGRSI
jgi:hypothetical protein